MQCRAIHQFSLNPCRFHFLITNSENNMNINMCVHQLCMIKWMRSGRANSHKEVNLEMRGRGRCYFEFVLWKIANWEFKTKLELCCWVLINSVFIWAFSVCSARNAKSCGCVPVRGWGGYPILWLQYSLHMCLTHFTFKIRVLWCSAHDNCTNSKCIIFKREITQLARLESNLVLCKAPKCIKSHLWKRKKKCVRNRENI